jgi:flagellar hook-associated protein 3 FlgL
MRISTNTLFETGSTRLNELQSSLAKTQEQISTSRRILTPSDDPVASAQALQLTQAQAINSQFAVNRRNATNSLNLEEQTLKNVTGLLQDVKTAIVEAGNGAYDDMQRKFIATELAGRFDELLGLANTRDGLGNFLFSGYQSDVQPYAKTATGAQYSGDQGQRNLQVGPSRQLAQSDAGSAVFDSIKKGNGTFATAATGTNTGSGVISEGNVINSAALTGHNYSITFTSATAFDVTDTTLGTVVSTNNAYTSGNAITFGGMQFDISGTPANGDSFTVKPSSNESIFTTLTDLIAVLNTPASTTTAKASLVKGLNTANGMISRALDNVLTVRASVGARLKELETLDSQGEDRDIQYAQSLGQLQDLDYTKAITDLTKQKFMLEASQQAFVKTSNLSLFNFLT